MSKVGWMKKSLSRIPRGGGASYVVFVLIVLFITICAVLSWTTFFSRNMRFSRQFWAAATRHFLLSVTSAQCTWWPSKFYLAELPSCELEKSALDRTQNIFLQLLYFFNKLIYWFLRLGIWRRLMTKKIRNNLGLHQPIEDSFSAYSVPSEMIIKIWITVWKTWIQMRAGSLSAQAQAPSVRLTSSL